MKRDIAPAVTETFERAIGGLLKRRQELLDESATLRDRMATIALDVQAVDRVLVSMGYRGALEARPARPERLMLFYRGEMRTFIIDALREAGKPLTPAIWLSSFCKSRKGRATTASSLARSRAGSARPSGRCGTRGLWWKSGRGLERRSFGR